MEACEVGGATESELEKFEIVMYPGLMIVQIFIVDHRSFDCAGVGGKPVCLRNECVRKTVPWQIIPQEQPGYPHCGKLFVAWVRIWNEMPRFDLFHSDQIRDPHAKQSAELFQPATIQHVVCGGRGRSSVFILGVFAPNNEGNIELHGSSDRNCENADMFGP